MADSYDHTQWLAVKSQKFIPVKYNPYTVSFLLTLPTHIRLKLLYKINGNYKIWQFQIVMHIWCMYDILSTPWIPFFILC